MDWGFVWVWFECCLGRFGGLEFFSGLLIPVEAAAMREELSQRLVQCHWPVSALGSVEGHVEEVGMGAGAGESGFSSDFLFSRLFAGIPALPDALGSAFVRLWPGKVGFVTLLKLE